jgi:hypothetical protein
MDIAKDGYFTIFILFNANHDTVVLFFIRIVVILHT